MGQSSKVRLHAGASYSCTAVAVFKDETARWSKLLLWQSSKVRLHAGASYSCTDVAVFKSDANAEGRRVERTRKHLKARPRVVHGTAASEGDVVQAVGVAVRFEVDTCHGCHATRAIGQGVGESAVLCEHVHRVDHTDTVSVWPGVRMQPQPAAARRVASSLHQLTSLATQSVPHHCMLLPARPQH